MELKSLSTVIPTFFMKWNMEGKGYNIEMQDEAH